MSLHSLGEFHSLRKFYFIGEFQKLAFCVDLAAKSLKNICCCQHSFDDDIVSRMDWPYCQQGYTSVLFIYILASKYTKTKEKGKLIIDKKQAWKMFWMSLIFCQEIFELFCHLFLNVRHCFLKWTVGMDFVVSFSHSYYNMQLNMKNITISSSCNISVLSMPFCNHVTFGSVQKIMALFFCIMHYIQPIMVGITNQACLFISLRVKQIRI